MYKLSNKKEGKERGGKRSNVCHVDLQSIALVECLVKERLKHFCNVLS
jgi:hypothetical protein